MPILPLTTPSNGNLGLFNISQVSYKQNNEKLSDEEHNKASLAPTMVGIHAITIEIIHPPPDIRNIVEKNLVEDFGDSH